MEMEAAMAKELCVIVKNQFHREDDASLFFSDRAWNIPPITYVEPSTDMYDLLVMLGTFASKTQARKNWTGPQAIPPGYSEWTGLGKLRSGLYILNPTIENMCDDDS
jgi:hypothetical protein